MQVENAVEDLLNLSLPTLSILIEAVSPEDVDTRKHYNHFMYQALLNCTKNSLNAVKKRVDPGPVDHFCMWSVRSLRSMYSSQFLRYSYHPPWKMCIGN